LLTCFLDNDIILKLSAFNVFEEAIASLDLDWQQLRVMDTAYYVFQGNRQIVAKYSEEIGQRAIAVTQRCEAIAIDASDEFLLLRDFIDIGEASLIAATGKEETFFFTTGDKRCLEALANNPSLSSVHDRLCGRTICLEQLIYRLIMSQGFEVIQKKIVSAYDCDRAIKNIFGVSTFADESTVITNLQSYINDLQLRSRGLLYTFD
jgi:hypothetical protein